MTDQAPAPARQRLQAAAGKADENTVDALVIDDSRAMRKILGRLLTGLGFSVREAGNGLEALSAIRSGGAPDLALVDWNMPVMDGLEFVAQVRADRSLRDVTLMMVTTESEHSQVVRALAAGAHEYVIKPFTVETIVGKLTLLGLLPPDRAATA